VFTEKILTIADIQTCDVLFYDPELRDKCYAFCRERNIDFLPALDEKHIYFRDEETQNFIETNVDGNYKISGTKNAFSADLLEIFRIQPLRMVFEDSELTEPRTQIGTAQVQS
jgi:hypothetical protein